jgi:hypothetical protein
MYDDELLHASISIQCFTVCALPERESAGGAGLFSGLAAWPGLGM